MRELNLAQYIRWDMVAMCAALAVVFAFEMLSVFTLKYVTITAIIRQTMPMWLRAMILGWMFYHFMLAPGNFQ